MPMLKAWAQLVRLPNVFTAPADVIAGSALAGWFSAEDGILHVVLSCLASICLYSAGMILNDLADEEEDRRDRPNRPLPSGRINRQHARLAAFMLAIIGCICASSVTLAIVLLGLILLYNFVLKNTFLGPLNMGLCRGCNLLLGAGTVGLAIPIVWWAAWTVTAYITGVTTLARDEVKMSQRKQLLVGSLIVVMSFVSLILMWKKQIAGMAEIPNPLTGLAIVMSIWMAFTLVKLSQVILQATPASVQSTIKFCIMGLVVLEAIHTMYAVGLPGLLVLLLLIPALLLGKVIYST